LEAVAHAWLDNPADRAAITEAVATADELLAIDPANQGESREGDRRIVFLGPLVLTIRLDESWRMVRVLNVRYPRRRSGE
jgi:hypothetical protein